MDNIEKSLKLFYDNKLVVIYSNNNRSLIKFLVAKEKIQEDKMSIKHTGTNSKVANPLTKGDT